MGALKWIAVILVVGLLLMAYGYFALGWFGGAGDLLVDLPPGSGGAPTSTEIHQTLIMKDASYRITRVEFRVWNPEDVSLKLDIWDCGAAGYSCPSWSGNGVLVLTKTISLDGVPQGEWQKAVFRVSFTTEVWHAYTLEVSTSGALGHLMFDGNSGAGGIGETASHIVKSPGYTSSGIHYSVSNLWAMRIWGFGS